MKTAKRWSVVLTAVSLISCSLFETKERTSSVPVRDVPYQARSTQDLRKRVLVLPFLDEQTSRSQRVTDVARQVVVAEILKGRSFVIVKNSDFPMDTGKFINEHREYALDQMAKTASSLGVAAIVEGKILEIKAKRLGDQVGLFRKVKARVETTVRIRIVSARNSRVILNEVRKGTVEDDTTRVAEYSYSDRYLEEDPALVSASVREAFRVAVPVIVKAIDKLSWEGRIALVSGERIFVNAGRLSGLQVGDLLKVTEEGEEVFDPDSGHFIGRAPGRMKGTVEIVNYFGEDGAMAVIHSGSGFSENDKVELY